MKLTPNRDRLRDPPGRSEEQERRVPERQLLRKGSGARRQRNFSIRTNVVNEYLDEIYEAPRLMIPKNPEQRALARSWMAFADEYFFPAIFGVRIGPQRGFSEDQIREANDELKDTLLRLEQQLESRQYLVGEYTLADIAHAGNFHRLRELAERGDVPLGGYPNLAA